MSKTIDERIVSMQFDNGKFEKNVATSMSTLDKLKEKLNFKGIDKSFSSISKSAYNVDMSTLGKAVENVRVKFSALQIAGITALQNITNSAINASKRIVSALTIDQIKSGFGEYELKMGSVQTIMASTGESLETINGYLNELNTYSDKTIYSFSDMTQNIGKFTNAGVKLKDAVLAIQGISNEAAVSGANANEASRAMYNFAQALSAGYVKLIDWKSIENANMATVEFKQQLIDTALECKTLSKTADGMYKVLTTNVGGKNFDEVINSTKNFNESLAYQWMTSEVLIKTLKKYADENTEIGKKAFQAATEIKTFTQLMDALKESIGSGWAQTWELIFGDYNQAKALWTSLYNALDKIVGKISDARNKLLKGALGNPFKNVIDKFNASGLGKVTKKVDSLSKSLKYYQKVVNDVWSGKYKNQPYRYDLLKKAGYDNPQLIQSLVDKGYKYKLTLEDINEAEKKYGKTSGKTTKAVKEAALSIDKLSDKQLKNKGFTEEEIKLLRQLGEEAKKTGKPINQLIEEMGKADGRSLLIDSFKNIWKGIQNVVSSIKKAWGSIFSPITSKQIYDIIVKFNEFTKKLIANKNQTKQLTRVFKGLFSALNVVRTLTAGPLKIAFKIFEKVLELCGTNTLELAAKIGDNIVKFNDWIDSVLDFEKIFDNFSPAIKNSVDTVKEWFKSFKDSSFLKDANTNISNFLNTIKDGFPSVVSKTVDVFKKIGEVLLNAFSKIKEYSTNIKDSITQSELFNRILLSIIDVGNKIVNFFKDVIDAAKLLYLALKGYDDLKFSDVIQTFKDFFALLNGGNTVATDSEAFESAETGVSNFQSTLQIKMDKAAAILDDFKKKISSFVDFIKNNINDNLGSILAIALLGSLIYESHKTLKVLDKFVSAISTFSSSAKQFTSSLTGFISNGSKVLKSIANRNNAEIIMVFARAIGMLALSLWVIALIPEDRLASSVATLIGLMTVFGIFSAILLKIPNLGALAESWKPIIAFAGAILLLASSLAIIANLPQENLVNSVAAIGILMAMMGIVSGALARYAPQLSKGCSSMILFAFAIRSMVGTITQINEMKVEDPAKIIKVLGTIVGAMVALTLVGKRLTFSSGSGMFLLVLSVKLLLNEINEMAKMDEKTIEAGLKGVISILMILVIVMRFVRGASAESSKAGGAVLAMAAGVVLIVYAIKALTKIEQSEIDKAMNAITKLLLLFSVIVVVSRFAGQNAAKAGVMLLLMSISIGILAGVMWLLKNMPAADLDRVIDAVSKLGLVLAAIIAATGLSKSAEKTITRIAIVLAVMALALAALTFIPAEDLKRSTEALCAVMISLGVLLALTGKMADDTAKAAGVLAMMVVVIAALGAILWGMSALNVQNAMENAVGLGVLLLAISTSIKLLSTTMDAKEVAKAAATMIILSVVCSLLGLILAEMTELKVQDAIPNAVALSVLILALSKSMQWLAKAGKGGIKAALVGVLGLTVLIAALALLMDGIGALVTYCPNIQKFMDNAIPLMTSLGTALGNLVGGFIGGVVGSSLVAIGKSLSDFWYSVKPFLDGVSGVDPSTTEGVSNLCKAILALTGTAVLDKLAKWLIGGADFTEIGKKLVLFGISMKMFSLIVKGIDVDAVNSSAEMAKGLANLLKEMPSSGGWLQKLTGEKDWSTISDGLVKFGMAMLLYANVVKYLTPDHATAIQNSVTAAGYLRDLQDSLPPSGGKFQKWFTGEKSWSTLSTGLIDFGKDLVTYGTNVANINLDSIDNSVIAAGKLRDLSNALPDKGGWFSGQQSLTDFGKDIVGFGDQISTFSQTISEVNTDSIQLATTLADSLNSIASAGIESYKETMSNAIPSVTEVIASMTLSSVNKLAEANPMFSREGSNLITSFVLGMGKKTKSAKAAAEDIGSKSASSAGSDNVYFLFKSAGDYVVQGFAAGITASTWRAEARAKAMARAAEQAAEEELGIDSPSKVFYKMGKFTVMGFVNALHDNISKSESASADMASSAVKGFKSAISKVSNLIENGMDTNPTIRPVVDLSNVKSGANAINGMLSGNRIMGLNTSKINYNVSGISRTMNNRQNGNSDVVDAVESLRNSVDNLKPGNAYTINGITYDDGSNVAKAIETLIRATKIERRV